MPIFKQILYVFGACNLLSRDLYSQRQANNIMYKVILYITCLRLIPDVIIFYNLYNNILLIYINTFSSFRNNILILYDMFSRRLNVLNHAVYNRTYGHRTHIVGNKYNMDSASCASILYLIL